MMMVDYGRGRELQYIDINNFFCSFELSTSLRDLFVKERKSKIKVKINVMICTHSKDGCS